jgi:pyridoxal phosphate enzyme (YggS family)
MQPSTALSIGDRLAAIRFEAARAAERAGRDPATVTLVGISKTYPVSTIAEAAKAGLIDVGENRAQELLPKADAAEAMGLRLRWHFVGHLQRNKVREVLPRIVALHSLDSIRLIDEIEREAERRAIPRLPCYLEVNVAGEQSKQGVEPRSLPALLDRAEASAHIEVAGLMTVAPQVSDAEQVRPVFRELRALASVHGLTGLSMGMSEDYTVAIEEGATVIRIGRALFGPRPD